jgi:hypothetical protein
VIGIEQVLFAREAGRSMVGVYSKGVSGGNLKGIDNAAYRYLSKTTPCAFPVDDRRQPEIHEASVFGLKSTKTPCRGQKGEVA